MTLDPSASRTLAGRYPFFTPALSAGAQQAAASVEVPLRLEHRHPWSPAEEYWDEPLEPALRAIVAAGPRDAWELEQVVPGRDWQASRDPIVEAVELTARAERRRARGLLEGLLAEDPRCLDAHAHLGSFASDYSAALAMEHFETGVAIGERSLAAGFDGVLPWGWIDNRPFLRCLHGYGLCLWRLGRLVEAAAVFEAMLWLNPADNQGARDWSSPRAQACAGSPGTARAATTGWCEASAAGHCSIDQPQSSTDLPEHFHRRRSRQGSGRCSGCSNEGGTACR